jgi:cytochrome bd ubiquinol oxidase subunit II
MDLNFLQVTWFLLLGVLLYGYAILDGFDLGIGVLHLFAKNEQERRLHMNAIGPVWDGNEVWLLTGGGAMFAAFPAVYATVFSGFYLAMMLVLLGLIFRAVSLEFRHQVENRTWKRVWDIAFGLGSLLPALLFGVALGNVMRGIPITAEGEFAGTFLGLLNPYSLLIGLTGLAYFILHGANWLGLKTEGELAARMSRVAKIAWFLTVALFVAATIATPFAAPHLIDGAFSNPVTYLALAIFAAAALYLPLPLRKHEFGKAFVGSALLMAAMFGLVGIGLYPNLVPSSIDLAYSLTVHNASATGRSLTAMLIIALLGMPVVIGYTIFIYRKFTGKVVLDESSY